MVQDGKYDKDRFCLSKHPRQGGYEWEVWDYRTKPATMVFADKSRTKCIAWACRQEEK